MPCSLQRWSRAVTCGNRTQLRGPEKLFRHVDIGSLELEEIFNASPNAYLLLDVGWTIVGCNPAYLSAVSRTREDILGRHLFEAFPAPADSESYKLLHNSLERVSETRQADHIAIIPYDTSRPGQPPALRYWSATHTPVFDRQGTLRYVLQHTVDITELQLLRERSERENVEEAGVLHRAHEVQAANLSMLAETKLLRQMFHQAPGFIGIVVGPEHRFVLANEAFTHLVGGRSLVDRTVAEAIPEVIEQGFVDLLDQVYRSGESHKGSDARVMLTQPGGEEPELHYIDFIYQPIISDEGVVTGIFVQGHDVTAKVEAERLHVLRQRELGHRLKNQLSIAQAIVSQTLRSALDPTVAGETIAQRLQALSSAHDVLLNGVGNASSVGEIVARAVEFLDEDRKRRVHITGDDIAIGSDPALSLTLLLHELTTNAVKHGALATEQGALSIAWGITGDGEAFQLTWQESGAPEISPPTHSGAGTKLINALVKRLGGSASTAFEPSGLLCTIRCDRSAFD
jgi:PAS domain S-box-containing protein